MRRYREATLRDASGNPLALVQKTSLVDPSKPKSVAIPADPVKGWWGREIKLLPTHTPDK